MLFRNTFTECSIHLQEHLPNVPYIRICSIQFTECMKHSQILRQRGMHLSSVLGPNVYLCQIQGVPGRRRVAQKLLDNVTQHRPVHHPLETHYDDSVVDEPQLNFHLGNLSCKSPPIPPSHYLGTTLCIWVSR
jgi:hypothetical protein